MHLFLKLILLFSLLTLGLHAEREKVKSSLVISGGVSLGAYESGYNWALIKMMNEVRAKNKSVYAIFKFVETELKNSLSR